MFLWRNGTRHPRWRRYRNRIRGKIKSKSARLKARRQDNGEPVTSRETDARQDNTELQPKGPAWKARRQDNTELQTKGARLKGEAASTKAYDTASNVPRPRAGPHRTQTKPPALRARRQDNGELQTKGARLKGEAAATKANP
jgi:hypothetical protein